MIGAVVLLLGAQFAGEVLARGVGLPVPGPIIGLLLLYGALCVRNDLEALLKPVTSTLLGNLSLLFVPAGVGVVGYLDLLRDQGLALAGVLVGSTVLSITVGAVTFTFAARLIGSNGE